MPKDDAMPPPPARRLFGTDGIRGTANQAPMDAAWARPPADTSTEARTGIGW